MRPVVAEINLRYFREALHELNELYDGRLILPLCMDAFGCDLIEVARVVPRDFTLVVQTVEERCLIESAFEGKDVFVCDEGWVMDPCRVIMKAGEWKPLELAVNQKCEAFCLGLAPFVGKGGFAPLMRLSSKVIAVRSVLEREGVGYGLNWVATRNEKIAIVSIGYGDGYPWSSGLTVSLSGRRCNIVGRVSMDMIAVQIPSDVSCVVGDEVVLWGREISILEVASIVSYEPGELMAGLTKRVRRLWLT